MYAIAFDLDTEILRNIYPTESWQNAYSDIRNILQSEGFDWQQGSVYFGRDVDAVTTVLAAQKVSKKLNWFNDCVRDIQMLRIEENSDLMPAIQNTN